MASPPVRRLPALGHQRSLLVPGRGCLYHCLTRGDAEGRRKLRGLGTLPFFGFVPSPCVGPSVMWEPRPCDCLQQSTGGGACGRADVDAGGDARERLRVVAGGRREGPRRGRVRSSTSGKSAVARPRKIWPRSAVDPQQSTGGGAGDGALSLLRSRAATSSWRSGRSTCWADLPHLENRPLHGRG